MLAAPQLPLPRPRPTHLVCGDVGEGRERLDHLCCHLRLALPHMAAPEQELSVEVAGLDGVQVDL